MLFRLGNIRIIILRLLFYNEFLFYPLSIVNEIKGIWNFEKKSLQALIEH